ncbi:hypothetical protein AC579_9234 [Pseudocercospora musae]|uniref:Uncharacterized protein n=1 Tax=Pseudocercospora musae TaxID=113226 RepID=A0A139IAM7_9PEZI|nr:hypothetical protein AC579_9234 [Pseudocercospora musae]KXT11780.1 hypothetical protein AC579_9234 [Pseudocercospora musae]
MAQEQMEADIHAHVLFTKPDSKHAAQRKETTDSDDSLAFWEESTCKELEVPYTYQNVAALIIHWAKHLDEELECKEKSEELHQLFQTHINFKSKILELHNEKPPQRQLRHALDTLALDHDGTCRSNLLIV